jgi:transcriptional regulator with XRE-family HTH domain
MASMANRTRPQYEAARLARWIRIDMGRELRGARRSAGMRQLDVARIVRTSTSQVCRIEHGQLPSLSLEALARHAAAVGLKPWLKLYPLGRRLLDAPQLELLARFRARLHPSWAWETEVPMPIAGDLRSGDCRITIPGCSALVEAYTRASDWQRQSSAAALKKRDLGATRLIMLMAATHANRRAIAEADAVTDGSFPLRTKAMLEALAAGRDPGADGIAFL